MSKRERIGVAVLVGVVALSLLLTWLLHRPDAPPESSSTPYYKQIQALQDTVANKDKDKDNDDDTVSVAPSHSSHSPHKSHSSHPQKEKKQPRVPLDEEC